MLRSSSGDDFRSQTPNSPTASTTATQATGAPSTSVKTDLEKPPCFTRNDGKLVRDA